MTTCTDEGAPAGRGADLGLPALVEEPYTAVADARERLGELLAAFEARDDQRVDFSSVYVRTSRAVAAGVLLDAPLEALLAELPLESAGVDEDAAHADPATVTARHQPTGSPPPNAPVAGAPGP